MHLRTGKDFDLEAVGRVHWSSRADAYAHILKPSTLASGGTAAALGEWWSERWKWEQETHRLTVAESDTGEIIGFTYVGPSETEGAVELYAIHVTPELVGTGIGRDLMINALEQLREIGGERAVLWVLEENERARRFYERGGWQPDGETRVEPINGEPVPQLRYAHELRPARELR
jgi:ribosomal protein S18 acetylase RimI-like enzyme